MHTDEEEDVGFVWKFGTLRGEGDGKAKRKRQKGGVASFCAGAMRAW
jgi:hypothetical protein